MEMTIRTLQQELASIGGTMHVWRFAGLWCCKVSAKLASGEMWDATTGGSTISFAIKDAVDMVTRFRSANQGAFAS